MTEHFTARFVYSDVVNGVRLAGVADDQFDTKRCILFTRMLETTDQEVRLGHDGVEVTIDDESNSCYGGVARVSLSNERLTLRLTKEAAESMGIDEEVVASIASGTANLDALAEALTEMMPGLFVDQRVKS